MDELLVQLIYPFLNFKSFYLLRISSKKMQSFTEKPYYWKIINFTNYPTLSEDSIINVFENEYLHVVNLSRKNNNIYSFPKNLLSKAKDIKIIMV
tara:strand:- start:469 stop:753 length:285 start_codon:yes stop_codon:yes gene_type:complete